MPAKKSPPRPKSARRRSAPRPLLLERPAADESVPYSAADIRQLIDQIVDAVGKLREALPPDASAQVQHHALPLTVDARAPSATILRRREAADRRRHEAAQHFESALALEDTDVAAARAAYLAALNAHNGHLEARINLGRLLHLNGELALAEKIYREARHSSALLSFNLAILLEDLSREEEAVVAYREALALDPTLHDAHFNLSRLHERAERPREALRHLLAYRRQTKDQDD